IVVVLPRQVNPDKAEGESDPDLGPDRLPLVVPLEKGDDGLLIPQCFDRAERLSMLSEWLEHRSLVTGTDPPSVPRPPFPHKVYPSSGEERRTSRLRGAEGARKGGPQHRGRRVSRSSIDAPPGRLPARGR